MISVVLDRMNRIGLLPTLALIANRIWGALLEVRYTELRRCRCCGGVSSFLKLDRSRVAMRCLRCGANKRYEALADVLKQHVAGLSKDSMVVELDPNSPLKRILGKHDFKYIRTYYSAADGRGRISRDGSRCEDITNLTFADGSIDLIISSDVLEHVPDIKRAFSETARVLKPGGMHIFTVPLSESTLCRAVVAGGEVIHLFPAEYHLDPLDPRGVLVFWDYGLNLPEVFSGNDLDIQLATKIETTGASSVWIAEKALNKERRCCY